MRAVDIVKKKRDGGELTSEELAFLIQNYAKGQIPDYQISAFLMAVFFRGMSDNEMFAMTREMRRSGFEFDLSTIPGHKVDKHSTGGVGDKTSLVIAPVLAAAGVIVPMLSGRALAHTGGTLDKLESIPGFNVRLSSGQFKEILSRVGACLIGQSEEIVPADRKLYALRDVTATVESHPLIAASIMSKKLAEGIDGLVLDVKTGSGAFMKRQEDAERLAQAMVTIGKASGKKVIALVTDMNQPLGEWVGNSLEIIECLEVLKGGGPKDLTALCEELSAYCLVLGERASGLEEARRIYQGLIEAGAGFDKFVEIVRAQGGNTASLEDTSLLPHARCKAAVKASESGYINEIDTEKVGLAMCILGAGRETVESAIDPAVGMQVHKKLGDFAAKGEAVCTVYYNEEARAQAAISMLSESYSLSQSRVEPPSLIRKVIS
jgi:pyrimidine-nucleoside phosphorylase